MSLDEGVSEDTGTQATAEIETQVDNQIAAEATTEVEETDDGVETDGDAEQTGSETTTATTERPKYSELKAFKKEWEPKVQEWEQQKPLYEAASALGPVQIVQELSKLAVSPDFADENEWGTYSRQAMDTILTAFPHLNGRIQNDLAWDYLNDEASQATIVQSFFGEKATPAKLTELWEAYSQGRIDDEWLAELPDPAVLEANKKAEAANTRIAQIEAQQAERESQDLIETYKSGIESINTSMAAPLDELITEFKLAPLPGDKPEVKAAKESIIEDFRDLVRAKVTKDAAGKQKWETMTKRIDAVAQTPVWKNANHAQRKQMLAQATKAAGDMYGPEMIARVRAIAAPYAKQAADRIASQVGQLGSQAKTAPVEAGSVASGGQSGKSKLPMPDPDENPAGFNRWVATGGMSTG